MAMMAKMTLLIYRSVRLALSLSFTAEVRQDQLGGERRHQEGRGLLDLLVADW